MEAASEPLDQQDDQPIGIADVGLSGDGAAAVLDPPAPLSTGGLPRARLGLRKRARVPARARQELLWITVVYLSARVLLVVAAYLQGRFGHHNILTEFANWDGLWYRRLANHGYPDYRLLRPDHARLLPAVPDHDLAADAGDRAGQRP